MLHCVGLQLSVGVDTILALCYWARISASAKQRCIIFPTIVIHLSNGRDNVLEESGETASTATVKKLKFGKSFAALEQEPHPIHPNSVKS